MNFNSLNFYNLLNSKFYNKNFIYKLLFLFYNLSALAIIWLSFTLLSSTLKKEMDHLETISSNAMGTFYIAAFFIIFYEVSQEFFVKANAERSKKDLLLAIAIPIIVAISVYLRTGEILSSILIGSILHAISNTWTWPLTFIFTSTWRKKELKEKRSTLIQTFWIQSIPLLISGLFTYFFGKFLFLNFQSEPFFLVSLLATVIANIWMIGRLFAPYVDY